MSIGRLNHLTCFSPKKLPNVLKMPVWKSSWWSMSNLQKSKVSPTQSLLLFPLLIKFYQKCRKQFGLKSLAIFGFLAFIWKFRTRKHSNIPSAPDWIPIVGHAPMVIRYLARGWLEKETEILQTLGKDVGMFSMNIATRSQIYVADPKIADLVFRQQFSDAIKADDAFDPIKVLLGDGIFTSNGTRWKKHRSVASHMFTVRSLRDYMFRVFVETTDELLAKFDEIHNSHTGGQVVDCYDMFNRLTFEAFTKVAFGVDAGCIASAPDLAEFGFRFDRTFHLCSLRFFSSIDWKWKRKWRRFGIAPYELEIDDHSEWLEKYVYDIIEERKAYYQQKISTKSDREKRAMKRGKSESETDGLKDRFDLLSMFLDDNPSIEDKELRDITFSFIIAGKDTTAQMLSWFMYHLYTFKLKEIENKIRAEIKNVFGTDDPDQLEVTYENVQKCQYLECCLKESLRLYPPVPHLVRTPIKDIQTPNGYTIRKGDEVLVSSYAMARMAWVWEDPLEFKPERFMDPKNQPDPSKYPAFNIAPRICLGKHVALLEGKIAIIKLFTKYKNITAKEGQDIHWVSSPTMQMSCPGFQAILNRE